MWNHRVYRAVPQLVVKRALPVSQCGSELPVWADLIESCGYLAQQCADQRFQSEPYLYTDFENMRTGFLFVEERTADTYFVYRDAM